MSAKILSATKEADGYHFRVLLDSARVRLTDDLAAGLLAGEPDPEWVAEWTWGFADHIEQHGQPISEADYLANIEAMLPGMIAQELERRGEALAPKAAAVVRLLHGKEIN